MTLINPNRSKSHKPKWLQAKDYYDKMQDGLDKNKMEAVKNLRRFLRLGKITRDEFDKKVGEMFIK